MTFEGFPIVVGLELTLACNLRCRHCASSAGNVRPEELSLDEVIDICDQLPALLVQEVDLTGGEPLVRDDWPFIAAHLKKLTIPVRMVTNGLLLKDNIHKLKETEIQNVGVSFDGLRKTHDRIRARPGLFDIIVDGVSAAIDAGIPVAAITAVNDTNVDELPQLLPFLKEIGIRHWQVQPTFCLGRASEGGLSLSEASFLKMGMFIQDHLGPCEQSGFDIMPADGVGYYTHLDMREKKWKGCPAGIASCGITSDGKVKGCISHPHHLVEGDLRQRDLWSIWFDETSFAYNRNFEPDQLGDHCKDCTYGQMCKGGCAIMSYAATGRFHNDPLCFHRLLEQSSCFGACPASTFGRKP